MNVELDEESFVLILFSTAVPIVNFFIRFALGYLWIVLIIYFLIGTIIPVYLSSRQQSVYNKANLIAWLKVAGLQNLTPKEREIIDKALGKRVKKIITEKKSVFKKYWKHLFFSGTILLSLLIAFIPTIPVIESKYINIQIKDYYFKKYSVGNTSQTLHLIFEVNTTQYVYVSTVKVVYENEKVGIEDVDRTYYSNTVDYFKVIVFLTRPVSGQVTVYLQTFPEKYSLNQTLKVD